MGEVESGWWHRLRWADCGICGREFRKGRGGGVSRRVLCSERCARQAWVNWLQEEADYRKAVRKAITGGATREDLRPREGA